MTVTDDLDRARSALQMINPAPYNAEAPPEALAGDLTPSNLHYVRSNFPLPTHDGTLEVGGAVQSPISLTLQDLRALPAIERAVTLECAGNGRLDMRPLPTGEPWGDYAVSTARWTGARLSDVLEQARPNADGVDVRFEGADHGSYHLKPVLAETSKADLTFVRALPLAHAADPAAEILIAYEMNGEPLGADHGAPFRLIAPHWYAVASVKWLKRIDVLTEAYTGEFQTGHYMYEWADRPHEPVTFMRVRARMTDPAPGSTIPPAPARSEARPGREPDRSPGSSSASPVPATGTPRSSSHPKARTSGRSGPSTGPRPMWDDTPSGSGPPMPPATSNPRSRPGIDSATATTPSKSPTST